MKLVEQILRFEKHTSGALQLKEKDISDYLIFNTLAMECLQSANALIEIGEYVVVQKKLGVPSTYREVFELLFKAGIITKEETDSAKRLVYLRNLISHEYYKISEDELREMVSMLEKIKRFVERIKKTEGNKND